MSNSPLITYTKLSPNNSGERTMSIDRLTPHCVVGQCTVETLGALFADPNYKASSNYGIGLDGRKGVFVPENMRSWCSSSNANDQRAITIECASDAFYPYKFNEVVYNALIDLSVDCCQRNGKKRLLWLGDMEKTLHYNPKPEDMVITVHRWFDPEKSCPGAWLYSRLGNLAATVTERLKHNEREVSPLDERRFNTVSEIPNWGKDTVLKLVVSGLLTGTTGKRDSDGYPVDLNLSTDMLRLLVINDRAGVYN